MRTTCIIFSSKAFKSKIWRGGLPEHKCSLKKKNTHRTIRWAKDSQQRKAKRNPRAKEQSTNRKFTAHRWGSNRRPDTEATVLKHIRDFFFFQAGLFSFLVLWKNLSGFQTTVLTWKRCQQLSKASQIDRQIKMPAVTLWCPIRTQWQYILFKRACRKPTSNKMFSKAIFPEWKSMAKAIKCKCFPVGKDFLNCDNHCVV